MHPMQDKWSVTGYNKYPHILQAMFSYVFQEHGT